MSAESSGDGVPDGVIADAFHQKGRSLVSLLQLLETTTCVARNFGRSADLSARYDA